MFQVLCQCQNSECSLKRSSRSVLIFRRNLMMVELRCTGSCRSARGLQLKNRRSSHICQTSLLSLSSLFCKKNSVNSKVLERSSLSFLCPAPLGNGRLGWSGQGCRAAKGAYLVAALLASDTLDLALEAEPNELGYLRFLLSLHLLNYYL